MALTPGQKLGPYEIVAPLGAGGMGEVYRAKDTRLKRDVAIKVLPADVATDHERLARFQREAEVLASLNHPHIAHVYGIEGDALVMELVEGEELSQRIARGPIPIDEALPIARQIAEALEAAHDHGIIHRDLKPANVKVRPDGMVKVLDFGLAKALDQGSGIGDQGSGNLANSPTITSPAMTMRGVVLGTAAYMAPEQAKGKPVDRRADIWAFGCVLYEMLTGQRTFVGEDVSDTLVSILRDDPRWAALPANTPPHVRLLLRRCLQRDPQKRLPHIGAARLDLADADTGELTTAVPAPASKWRLAAIGGAIAGAAITGAIVFVMRDSRAANSSQAVQFTITASKGSTFAGGNAVPRFAVSRDGQYILYQADEADSSKLWIRPIGAAEAVAVPGSGAERGGNTIQQAFWSPDNRFIGFFDEVKHELKRLDRNVGVIQAIAPVPGNQYGGAWNSDDVIIMSSQASGGVQRVPAAGGPIEQLTKVDAAKHEESHLWPQLFPDGRHFVFLVSYTDRTPSALFLGSLDGGTPQQLVNSPSSAVATTGNYLIYVRDTSTVAQQVDLSRGTLVGDPVLIGRAAARTLQGRAALAVSQTGVLTYTPDDERADGGDTRWIDRTGAPLPNAPRSVSTGFRGLRLSPDDSLLAYLKLATGGATTYDIWVEDLARGIESKVAGVAGPGLALVFSPDGKEVITRAFDSPNYTLFRQALFSAAPPTPIFTSENGELPIPHEWTPDGQQLIVSRALGTGYAGELWTVPIDRNHKPVKYTKERVRSGADVSPDGRWLAYTVGNEQGRGQVFIKSYPDPAGGNFPVSEIGGSHPRWRSDGRELFFLASGQLMAVDVSTTPRVTISRPQRLFDITRPGETEEMVGAVYPYDVTSDGRRFVIREARRASQERALIVITNWMQAFGIKH